MRTRNFALVIVALVLTLVGTASAQTPRTTPYNVDLKSYPIMKEHTMTVAEMAQLGLHPVTVTETTAIDIYTHRVNTFISDELRPGDIVAANEAGEWVYKTNCTNRIKVRKPCPTMLCTPAPVVAPPAATAAVPAANTPPAPPSTPWYMSWPFWLLGQALVWLVVLTIIALFCWLIVWLFTLLVHAFRNYNDRRNIRQEQQALYPAYQQAPIAPVVPRRVRPRIAVHPVLGRPLQLANGNLRYGPFENITVSDQQVDGFHVAVDGEAAGTFLDDVYIQNAGADGSYLIVTA